MRRPPDFGGWAMRLKSAITFCNCSKALPPAPMTPFIASTTFCIGLRSGSAAIAAFACLTPGMPDAWSSISVNTRFWISVMRSNISPQ